VPPEVVRERHSIIPSSGEFVPAAGGDREFDDLANDIKANGLREAIWLDADGSIIDGRNRLRACLLVDVVPAFRTWTGPRSPIDFVISMNLSVGI